MFLFCGKRRKLIGYRGNVDFSFAGKLFVDGKLVSFHFLELKAPG